MRPLAYVLALVWFCVVGAMWALPKVLQLLAGAAKAEDGAGMALAVAAPAIVQVWCLPAIALGVLGAPAPAEPSADRPA